MESTDKTETPVNKLLRLRNSYLDLMQSWLTGSLYRDRSEAPFGENTFDTHLREHGLDWPAQAQTMIGTKRITNLRALTESVIIDNIPGDFIETGVWRGGACILMRAVLYAHGITDRCVWVADSFEGLPVANKLKYPADTDSDFHTYEQLAVSLEQVQENFRAYGLLDAQTKFLKGWFKDTLPTAPIQQLALIRLDGDMYESTMDGLINLYPKLSHLGYVIIDDYDVVPACKEAVHDYCNTIGIQPEIIDIDGVGVYWRKFDVVDHSNVSIEVSQTPLSPDIQISHLNEHLIDLSKKAITCLKQTLVDRDGDIDRLKQTLIAIYSSTSWRVTKPVRFIKNIINGSWRDYDETQLSQKVNYPITSEALPILIWEDDSHLKINDVSFYLSYDTNELLDKNSTKDHFLLGKPKHMVEKSIAIGQRQKINKIFEMGILQGGSVVLYDQIFKPEKIVAIDHEPKPVDVLANYIKKHRKYNTLKPYYGVNQADRSAMEKILSAEYPDKDIDFIIDDASHLYTETREAFNICFPYLKKGGLYCIEDWAWAHWSGDYWQQGQNSFLNGKTALSNLLVELLMLTASRPDFIKDIFVDHNVIIVKRGDGALPVGEFNIADHYLLRGKQFDAWL